MLPEYNSVRFVPKVTKMFHAVLIIGLSESRE